MLATLRPDDCLTPGLVVNRGCVDLCKGCVDQMMPLLIAVAIAIARLLAENF